MYMIFDVLLIFVSKYHTKIKTYLQNIIQKL